MISFIIRLIREKYIFFMHKRSWRNKNVHNFTSAKKYFPIEKVTVGKGTYGSIDVDFYGNPDEELEIGHFCSIAGGVKFITGGGHDYTHLSTYPFKKFYQNNEFIEATTKGKIVVEDDVWIGHGSIILSGLTIGQGSVIGAGSIVSKSVPPYSIYVGNKVLKKRFSGEKIEKLLRVDFSNFSEQMIKENLDLLYSEVNDDVIDHFSSLKNN